MNMITKFKLPISMAQYLSGQEDATLIVVYGDSMLPVFRHGDCLLVDHSGSLKIGDRVIARDFGGEIFGGTLLYRTEEKVIIAAFSRSKPDYTIKEDEVSLLGRVIWASQ